MEVAANLDDLGRVCRVHCLAAEVAACATGRILMSQGEERSGLWACKLDKTALKDVVEMKIELSRHFCWVS